VNEVAVRSVRAWSRLVDHKHFEAFSCQEQRCCRASAPTSDDDNVVQLHLLRRSLQFRSLHEMAMFLQ